MASHVLAIDEGSTGVRALIFDASSRLVAGAYREIESFFPQPGWVEQDPLAIWEATLDVVRQALSQSAIAPADIAAVGIAVQRATTLVWERRTGRPVYAAISWQDTRTAPRVAELMQQGVFAVTGASSTKLEWILRRIDDGFTRAEKGELCFGTVDTWLAWQISGGAVYVSDASNASCTGLFMPFTGDWDDGVLAALKIPRAVLPVVRDSSEHYGNTDAKVFGASVPIAAVAGDQQAAMFGELGTEPGAVKITFGTSAMVDIHTGDRPVFSQRGAFPLILWSLGGRRPFCLEGQVITAGAAVQWLRDGLGVILAPEETAELAASVADTGGVWVVPALQGLGSPYVDSAARAVIGGISRGTTRAHIVRAVLEGIAFRTREVYEALLEETQTPPPAVLRVDGGAAANDFLLQGLASVLGQPVERPETVQASALGVAYLAGMAVGVWKGVDDVRGAWRSGGVFEPRWSDSEREERFAAWRSKVSAARLGSVS